VNEAPSIVVQDLCKTYGGRRFRRGVEALKGVSFEVRRGEVFGLLGPNGAGKTTLIKVLLGLLRATRGKALLLGAPAGRRASRRRVGYLPEQLRMPGYQTPYTALEFYGQLSGLARRQIVRARDELLQRVGLAPWARTPVRKFSKGMLQRLGLAQALLHDPDVLILDEPTDGLDPLGRRQVRDLLARLRAENKTVFLNSHLLQEVELICDRVAILDAGDLRRVGPIDDITSVGAEVELQLAGPGASLAALLAEVPAARQRAMPDGAVRIRLAVEGQAEVDQWVDRVRACGLSLLALERCGATLEDAFLRLLTPERPPR
jgi:ABC-2 type transport system ATP-binding protein